MQAEGLVHRTFIALPLARGLSQSDRLFPTVQKQNKKTNKTKQNKQTNKKTNKQTNKDNNNNKILALAWIPIQKQDLASPTGIMRRARDVDQYPKDRWSTNSRDLQDIRIEKPDERHKSLILINAYIHLSTCITGVSWDFLEEMADEL